MRKLFSASVAFALAVIRLNSICFTASISRESWEAMEALRVASLLPSTLPSVNSLAVAISSVFSASTLLTVRFRTAVFALLRAVVAFLRLAMVVMMSFTMFIVFSLLLRSNSHSIGQVYTICKGIVEK